MYNITKKDLEAKFQEKNIIEGEFQDNIINYEDYKSGYTDTIYQFIIDNSIFYVAAEYEDQGLNIIIDYLEDKGDEHYFIDNINGDNFKLESDDGYIVTTDGNSYYSDEYITGGNSARYLYHGGSFSIEELNV